MIIDEYMEQNKNVKIEVETLDEEAYKVKFKAYSMEGMPDVVSIWGQPAFLDEVLDAGVLAELNQDDYKDYTFVSGSLDGFMKDGKLYGLPRNTDVAGFYYNQKMFEDNGWEIPKTYDDLLALAGQIKDAGIIPLAMDGGDGWPLAVYLSDIMFKLDGSDYKTVVSNAIANGDFSDPSFKTAAELLRKSAEAGLFQNGFDTQDYGTAQNLFTNGQAAMYYMGSWDASMALNEDIAPEIRDNIRMFTMPTIENGKGTATDIAAWNGGGKAEGVFRCIYFIPNVISVAVIAYLWKFIYNPDFGLLNNVIKAFGGKGDINWFSTENAIWSVLIVLIWHGFGWGMLIYYTGIKNIDPVLYEAAAIDGADQKTTFFKITLPLMKPVIQVNVTMAVISALKQMETVYLLTNGGPNNQTQFAANYLYQQAFKAYKYGYGNAIGVVFIVICLAATVLLNWIFSDRDEVNPKIRKKEAAQ